MLLNKINYVNDIIQSGNKVTLDCGERKLGIKVCSPEIMNIKLLPAEEYGEAEKIIADRQEWDLFGFSAREGSNYNEFIVDTGKIKLVIRKAPFGMKFLNSAGKLLSATREYDAVKYAATEDANGVKPVQAAFRAAEEERFYGLGDGGKGFERSGTDNWLWTRETQHVGVEIPAPFVISSEGYAVFFHNPHEARIKIVKGASLTYEAAGGTLDFYFIYGPSMDELVRNYYEITGYPVMIPRWAFGYQQSTRHFINSQEVSDLPRHLRERKIPCDHITFLSTYSFIFSREQGWDEPVAMYDFNRYLFPKAYEMIKSMRDMNFNLMCHQYPQVGKGIEDYDDFVRNGYGITKKDGSLLDFSVRWRTSYIDFTNPEAARWWWSKVKKIYDAGINSWWNDGGEGPLDGQLHEGSYRKCHNVFDLFRDKTLYENHRRDFPEKRVMQRCRSGYSGLHKFGVVIQPGDMDSSLDILSEQIEKSLNSALSGNPFRAPDMGGHYSQITQQDGTVCGVHTYTGGDTRTDEVFMRWVQYCTFSPVMWAHGHPERSKLPWMRGPEIEELLKKYINLRYRLIPYIYTCVWLACSRGLPFMRPLVMDYPDDTKVHKLGTQYMFGPNLLAAPVLEEGVQAWEVYLPEGKWYDFWNGSEYEGGRKVSIPVDITTFPVFAREGAIIPMGPEMQYTGEKPVDPLTLLVYPGASSEFTIYEDDGDSYGYQKGGYATTAFSCINEAYGTIKLVIGKAKGFYEGMLERRDYIIKLHSNCRPLEVRINGNVTEYAENGDHCWWHDDGAFICIKLCGVEQETSVELLR